MSVAKIEEKRYTNGMFNSIYQITPGVATETTGSEETIPIPNKVGALFTVKAICYSTNFSFKLCERPNEADYSIHEILRRTDKNLTFGETDVGVHYNSLTENLYFTFINGDDTNASGTITLQLIGR